MRLEEAAREKREHESEKDAERRAETEARMRLAVGRYRHAGARNVVFWASIAGLPAFAIGLVVLIFELVPTDAAAGLTACSVGWMLAGLGLWGSEIVWRASAGTMERERRWLASLPFPVTGYFEWLGRYLSSSGGALRFTLRGDGVGGRREELLQLIAASSPTVRIADAASWKGGVNFEIDDVGSRDDDQRARVIHEVIDRVLVPVHHETPISALEIQER